MRLTLSVLLVLTGWSASSAQTVDDRINDLNSAFPGTVKVRLDKQQRLVVDFYAGAERFRQDLVPLAQLDPAAVTYSAEEDAVVIGCLTAYPQCIDKEIFKLNTIRRTGRSNLPCPPDDPGGARVMDAVKALLSSAQEQLSALPGETRIRTVRSK